MEYTEEQVVSLINQILITDISLTVLFALCVLPVINQLLRLLIDLLPIRLRKVQAENDKLRLMLTLATNAPEELQSLSEQAGRIITETDQQAI